MAMYAVLGRARFSSTEMTMESMALFKRIGAAPGTTHLWAGLDGKTFVNIVESDDANAVLQATTSYGPYLDLDVIPVVAVDESAVAAMEAGHAAWSG